MEESLAILKHGRCLGTYRSGKDNGVFEMEDIPDKRNGSSDLSMYVLYFYSYIIMFKILRVLVCSFNCKLLFIIVKEH